MSESDQSAPGSSSSTSTSTSTASQSPSQTATAQDPISSFLDSGQRPSYPWFPAQNASGPLFLDGQNCLCVLRDTPDGNSNVAWRCFGNHSTPYYVGNTGKWFGVANPALANVTTLPMDDDSDPPQLDDVLVAQQGAVGNGTAPLVSSSDPNAVSLSQYDAACTGENSTVFSTAYYRVAQGLETNQFPVEAAPCYRAGGFVPVQIVNLTAWQAAGDDCARGFYCPNNTVNSLPEYCPPIPECQDARLAGVTCVFPPSGPDSVNAPMGPFEPVVCTKGYYCPNGREQIVCPQGHFCPQGAFKPTPCISGSVCPQGAVNEYQLLPLALLIVLDAILIAILLVVRYRDRMHLHRRSHTNALFSKSALMNERKGYASLEENELDVLEPRAAGLHRSPTGFETAMHAHMKIRGQHEGELDVQSSPELQQFVESMRLAIQGSNFGLTFDFEGLSFHPKGLAKPVISDITGTIRRGTLAAIMGGSGAGKSTFFNALIGRQSHGGVVAVNGVPMKMRKLRRVLGYVPQDDIVLPELTVRENILHSARIRLPRSFSQNHVNTHVDAVVDCLELTHVRDSLVGSVAKPVISGGQRKRVSIGMELAAAPMALFLDEPTSGLDATSAAGLMKTLKAISKLGISVIAIIHQPRSEIFDMIDDLLLLGNGRLIYQGSAHEVGGYFEEMGYHIPDHTNLGDVVTDIITGNGRVYKPTGDTSKEALISHYAGIANAKAHLDETRAPSLGVESASLRSYIKNRGTPWPRQLYFDLNRAMLQQYRTISAFWFEMGVAALGGFLIGLAQNGNHGQLFTGLFLGDYAILSTASDYKTAAEMSLLVCVSIGLIAAAPGVKVFAEEKLVYKREAEAGHGAGAYYAAKVISTLPRMLLGCLHFTTTLLLLSTPLIPWGTAFATNLLYFFCIYGLASCVSMATRREDGPLLAVMASLIVAVLSGAAPPLSKVQSWHMQWLWYMSPGVWAAEVYWAENVRPTAYLYQVDLAAEHTGFDLDRTALDMVLLLAIGVVYRFVAFGGLLLTARPGR